VWLWEVYWSILLPWYWDMTHTLPYTPVWYFCTLSWNQSFHEPSPTNNIIWECQMLTPWVHLPTYFSSTHLINLIHTLSGSNPSLGLYLPFWASPPQDHLSLALHLHTLLLGSVAHVHRFCHFVCNYDRMGSYLFCTRIDCSCFLQWSSHAHKPISTRVMVYHISQCAYPPNLPDQIDGVEEHHTKRGILV
jgi:hypothetical protein